jgi:Flp pilus assembly protein TadG
MIMKKNLQLLRNFSSCKKGMAATEFALLLPVMFTLFFGMLETSDVATENRRVAIAVNTISDLAAQSTMLTYDDINNLIGGALQILDPAAGTVLNVNVVSVILDPNNGPVVHWSRDELGAQPYTPGDQYTSLNDNTVLSALGSLIVVEITYPYSPPFTSYFVSSPVLFAKTSIRWPRLASRVQLCDNNGANCTT